MCELKEKNAVSEGCIGVTREWERTEDAPWGVFILDALVITPPEALVVDFKTGRPYPIAHGDQALFYACAVLSVHENVERVIAEMWYLKTEGKARYELHRTNLNAVRDRITARALTMESDKDLPPKPSKSTCKWCQYRDDCEYNATGYAK